MLIDDSGRRSTPPEGNRRDFLKRVGLGAAAAAAVGQGAGTRRAAAQSSSYPDWIAPSAKTPKRGGTLTRASAWDPPVLDPRLTNSVGLFQIASLVGSRLVRFPFTDEAPNTADLTLKGDLAESWSGSTDQRVWTFKLRQGVKWHNVAPLNGRELVAADIKYCFEQYAKEGVQAFTFQEIEGMETPDKHTVRVHLKTPNTMFPQNLAEAVSVIFSREVLEEDGDLKKRMIGTGPYTLKEHTRKVRAVLARHPDYFDKGRPYFDEYIILSTPDAATRTAAFRTGQSDSCGSPASARRTRSRRPTRPPSSKSTRTCRRRSAWRWPRTSRRSTTCACGAPSPWPSTARSRSIPSTRAMASSAGASPTSTSRTRRRRRRSSAPTGSTGRRRRRSSWPRPAIPNGFETTLFYYEYFPQMSSQVQLVQSDLKKNLNINVKISKLDYTTFYGRYAEGKWDGMAWGFKTGYAVGLDEQTYQYMHSKSTKNYFRFADPVVDELCTKLRQTPDKAEQRVITKKIFDREHDQVLRMWMPYDAGFLIFQPHMRNIGALAMRRTDGYGASTVARIWSEK